MPAGRPASDVLGVRASSEQVIGAASAKTPWHSYMNGLGGELPGRGGRKPWRAEASAGGNRGNIFQQLRRRPRQCAGERVPVVSSPDNPSLCSAK